MNANVGIEGERFLQTNQALPCRSIEPVVFEPGTGLLWGEDWECERVSELDEGSEGV